MAIIHHKIGIGHHTLVNTHYLSDTDAAVFSPNYWTSRGAVKGQAKGRGTTLFVQPDSQHQWVLRHYRRGGLIGKVLTDQFLYAGLHRTRPFMELHLLDYMQQCGLNVPVGIGAQVKRSGLIYRADLLTMRIPEARDLHHVLTEQPLDDATWKAVGSAIRKMHDAQVYHHDLNVRNIMLDKQEQVWIIDFDRCAKRNASGWKKTNLERLRRSFEKEMGRSPTFYWDQQNWNTLINGYQDA